MSIPPICQIRTVTRKIPRAIQNYKQVLNKYLEDHLVLQRAQKIQEMEKQENLESFKTGKFFNQLDQDITRGMINAKKSYKLHI